MKLMSFSAVAGALVLAGCASAPAPEAPQMAAGAAAAAAPVQQSSLASNTLTGSRIPKQKSNDRMLKSIGNQDFRDSTDIKSIGNTLRGTVQ